MRSHQRLRLDLAVCNGSRAAAKAARVDVTSARFKSFFTRQWVCKESHTMPCSEDGPHVLQSCGWRWVSILTEEDFDHLPDFRLVPE